MEPRDGMPTVSTDGERVFITFPTDRGSVTRMMSVKAAGRLAADLAAKLAAFGATYEPPGPPPAAPAYRTPDPLMTWVTTT